MSDRKPFEPHKPEKMIDMQVSVREAKILTYMRKSAFGKYIIHKLNNVIVRIEPQTSYLVDEEGSLELQ